MKYLLIVFMCLGATFTVNCSNKQVSVSQQKDTITDDGEKAFRRQTFECFINLNEAKAKESEKLYLELLGQYGSENESDVSWYRNNIAHIDSLSRYCIELSDNGENKRLLNILESEIGNFQSHPNATIEICFDLNCILTELYLGQRDLYPDYLNKCIGLWELNRAQINAVQSGWHEYHPLYIEVLEILSSLYKKANNTKKVAEIENMIKELSFSNL